jgi:hypothetical protein
MQSDPCKEKLKAIQSCRPAMADLGAALSSRRLAGVGKTTGHGGAWAAQHSGARARHPGAVGSSAVLPAALVVLEHAGATGILLPRCVGRPAARARSPVAVCTRRQEALAGGAMMQPDPVVSLLHFTAARSRVDGQGDVRR